MVDASGCRNSPCLEYPNVHSQPASIISSDSEDAELAAVGVRLSAVGAEDDSHLVTVDTSLHLSSSSSSSCPGMLSLLVRHSVFLSVIQLYIAVH